MQHDHMIEALTTNGSNHSLDIGPLPRRAGCRQDLADAHISQLFSEIMAENGITVAQQVARQRSEGNGLSHLQSRPPCGWMRGKHLRIAKSIHTFRDFREAKSWKI